MQGAQTRSSLVAIQEQQLRLRMARKRPAPQAERREQQQAIVPVPEKRIRRKIQGDINRMTEPGIFVQTSTRARSAMNPTTTVLEMFLGEDGIDGNGHFKAFELNIKFAQETEDDMHQRSVYYAGAICCLLPSMKEAILEACERLGYGISETVIPRDMNKVDVPYEPIMNGPRAIAMWGLIVLMLFKNPSAESYPEFSKRRIKALVAVANVIEKEDIIVFPDLQSASQFASAFGQQWFKKELLTQVLDLGQQNCGPMSQVCNYIKTILQWTELAGFVFIFNTLILTNSPLLNLDEMRAEVRNFYHAMGILINFSLPAYFKILGPVELFTAFERQKFPTLMAVARELKAKTTKTVSQFVSPLDQDKGRIQELADLHTKMDMGDDNTGVSLDIKFLTQAMETYDGADDITVEDV